MKSTSRLCELMLRLLQYLDTQISIIRKKNIWIILVIIVGIFPRLFNLLYFHSLESDEAFYANAIFTLSNGYIPYKDIFIGHPPIHFYLALPFYLVFPSLYSIRLFNVILGVATLAIIYKLGLLMFNKRIATIAALIYAVYPFAIYSSKLNLVDNSMVLFVTVSIFFLVKYVHQNDLKKIVLCGFFAGLASITKFTGLYSSIAIFLFIILFIKKIKPALLFALSLIIIPTTLFSSLFFTGIWEYFWAQTINWQFIRFSLYPSERLWFGLQGVCILSPLIILTMLNFVKGSIKLYDNLMLFLFLVPLIIILLFKVVFLQYFVLLLVPLCIQAARQIDNFLPISLSLKKNYSLKKITYCRKKIFGIIIFATITIFFLALMTAVYGIDSFLLSSSVYNVDQNLLLENQMSVGSYINNITLNNEKIWSSNPAFGFFSKRIIVSPNSTDWKFRGFYPDVWGYQWTSTDYRGPIANYPTGLFTLSQIKEAWIEDPPKIIILDNTNRTNFSAVDFFVWNGIDNSDHSEKGLSSYIKQFYHLSNDIEGISFTSIGIDIWIKN